MQEVQELEIRKLEMQELECKIRNVRILMLQEYNIHKMSQQMQG